MILADCVLVRDRSTRDDSGTSGANHYERACGTCPRGTPVSTASYPSAMSAPRREPHRCRREPELRYSVSRCGAARHGDAVPRALATCSSFTRLIDLRPRRGERARSSRPPPVEQRLIVSTRLSDHGPAGPSREAKRRPSRSRLLIGLSSASRSATWRVHHARRGGLRGAARTASASPARFSCGARRWNSEIGVSTTFRACAGSSAGVALGRDVERRPAIRRSFISRNSAFSSMTHRARL